MAMERNQWLLRNGNPQVAGSAFALGAVTSLWLDKGPNHEGNTEQLPEATGNGKVHIVNMPSERCNRWNADTLLDLRDEKEKAEPSKLLLCLNGPLLLNSPVSLCQ